MQLTYYTTSSLTPEYVDMLRGCARSVFKDGLKLNPTTDPWQAQLHLSPELDTESYLNEQFQHFYNLVPWPGHDDETLYLDIETFDADHMWNMEPQDFFRLGQWAWGIDGEVHTTTDYNVALDLIRKAYGVVAHFGHMFDLTVMFGRDSMEPLFMAKEQRVFDTFVHANLVNPAPFSYTDRNGHTFTDATKPEKAKGWLSLDNQCYQLGVPGKVEDLKKIAKKHGGFDEIPIDDPDFLEYARGDITALQQVTRALLSKRALEPYDWREQLVWAINAQMARNGVMVDTEKAQARVNELQAEKDVLLGELEREYGFPTEGKMPWRSNPGKDAIMNLLADHGITPESRPNWTKTKTGNLSLGGDVMIELTAGTDIEPMGEALATLMGQRALAQQALTCTDSKGYSHPQAVALQRSGRFSTSKPSMTVWSARGDKAIEKEYFIAEPGHAMLEFDYSSADGRAVAVMSGDEEFAKRFAPGAQPYDISGELFWGSEVYYLNKEELRPTSKNATLALGYRVRAPRLSEQLGIPLSEAWTILRNYEAAYPKVVAWQEAVTAQGEHGFVRNKWGRRMVVDWGRAFTQAPGLMGQSFTREVLVDGLIEMLELDPRLLQWLRFTVHDAVVASVPLDAVEYAQETIRACLVATFGDVEFVVATGEPAENWFTAGH